MSRTKLQISLYGGCVMRTVGARSVEISGKKQKAMIALLVDGNEGRRSRDFLAKTLWRDSTLDTERAKGVLRRTLTDMRKALGEDFASIFETNNQEIRINLSLVEHLTFPSDGLFLEDFEIQETAFKHWLNQKRDAQALVTLSPTAIRQKNQLKFTPTIAVLPLMSLNGGRDSAVIGDWMAEDISRSLARSSLISVISHLSARRLNQRAVTTDEIRANLGSDYAVTGTVREGSGQIIAELDFIETATGEILWTRRFAAQKNSVFDLNSELTGQVTKAIGETVVSEAIYAVRNIDVVNVPNRRLLLAGIGYMHRNTLGAFSKARPLLEEAINRATGRSELLAWLAKWYILAVTNGWSSNPQRDISFAFDATARALDINPTCPMALTMDGFALNNLRHDLGVAGDRFEAALDVNPNEGLAWLLKGALCAFADRSAEAVKNVGHARHLSPIDPLGYFYDSLSATAHFANHENDRALQLASQSLSLNNRHASTMRVKLAALSELGRDEDAANVAAEILNHQPNFTVDGYLATHPAAHFEIGKRMANALASAGIPKS
ncbi:MAG: hypothetical protein AAFY99_01190 [Pseudomonadota bacterium]